MKARTHTDLYLLFGAQHKDFRNENLMELVLSLTRGKTLLDVGCGYGPLLIKARQKGLDAYGLEPDPALVALARQHDPSLRITPSTLEAFESTELYDNVVLIDILECVPAVEPVLEKCAQLVKSGGQLIVVAPALSWLFGARDRMMGYYRRCDREPLTAWIRALGLHIVHVRYWNALLVIPYALLYQVLNRQSQYEQLRGQSQGLVSKVLFVWFKWIENKINFGFGLSLIVVAQKKR